MATLKQMIANRLNALKSTGPRSAEGKARSARNATTHGLSRIGAMPASGLADAIADRKEQWRNDFRPAGSAQEWLFERLCAESVRLDGCERRILVCRAELADRAAESWDDDCAADIAALAAKLADRPEVIQPKLLQGRHGVLWLLDRWDEVADSLNRCAGWSPETWDRAMDYLGLSTAARAGTGPWDLDSEDNGPGPGLELVRRSVEALRQRLGSYLDARDVRARAAAEAGLGGDEPPELRRLERYAADARRRVAWCRAELIRLQSSAEPTRPARVAVTPPPRPVRKPAPPPASAPPNVPAAPVPTASSPESPAPAAASGRSTTPNVAFSTALRDRLSSPAPASNRRARRAQAAAARRG